MMHCWRVILLLWMMFFGGHLQAVDLYVSPSGNDHNPGTSERPLQTLVGARDRIRALSSRKGEGVTVFFRAGVYPFKTAVEFDDRDSGVDGGKIIYRASEGERVVFDGCDYAHGWVLYSKEKGIYRARVESGGFRQLYVDDQIAIRARYPNRDEVDLFGPFLPIAVDNPPDLLIGAELWQPIGSVSNFSDVEIFTIAHWYQQILHVAPLGKAGGKVAVRPLYLLGNMGKPKAFYNGALFRAENALEFLDSPGEWYFDRRAQFLYYKPASKSSINDLGVAYPVSSGFISAVGRSENPVQYVEFNGFIFQCSNWTYPTDHSLSFTQFAQPLGVSRGRDDGAYPSGAISFSHARNIALRNNVFKNIGATAIQFYEDVDDSDIEGNRIFNVSGNAIEIDVPALKNPIPERQSVGVAIWNNEIFRAGQSYSNGGGVLAHNVKGLIVEHNWFHDMPYSCLQVCDQPDGKDRDVGCAGNRIRFNRIERCMQLHDDGGGIYTLGGVQRGSVIADNYVSEINPGRWAGSYPLDHIYLDNFTTGILVWGNVVSGGRAAQRNGAYANFFGANVQSDRAVEESSGILKGFRPIR